MQVGWDFHHYQSKDLSIQLLPLRSPYLATKGCLRDMGYKQKVKGQACVANNDHVDRLMKRMVR